MYQLRILLVYDHKRMMHNLHTLTHKRGGLFHSRVPRGNNHLPRVGQGSLEDISRRKSLPEENVRALLTVGTEGAQES